MQLKALKYQVLIRRKDCKAIEGLPLEGFFYFDIDNPDFASFKFDYCRKLASLQCKGGNGIDDITINEKIEAIEKGAK